ncbi:aldehyde dehydrogenase EutE [Paenibacillus alba]|uniref:aldehyde dehydrogenase family protein n=1 Tax=Paenibacillus alba TaxID=1197127 RepID=UPI00156497F4|nr:aldehyde dehydrogenase family protein [Paenibacillus alba]NQX69023.1 aldehyde dehydrogenase EutE [Paenibacillus alba]
MSISEADIRAIVAQVIGKLQNETAAPAPEAAHAAYEHGVFATVDEAVDAASLAFGKFSLLPLAQRETIIRKMRETSLAHAAELAELAVKETGLGRVQDKLAKNKLAAEKTPGIEDLFSQSFSGDNGLTLLECSPFGVIGSITPTTNPAATMINNSISMVSAGNAVVYNPHPSAKKVSIKAMQLLNQAIVAAGGPENMLTSVLMPTLDTSEQLMKHPNIQALVVTGGGAVVKAALTSGKKVIAAGPGNPPVVVDETADLKQAGRDIVLGASFDNNVLCTAEKEVFVVESVANGLKAEMLKNGAYELKGYQLTKLLDVILTKHPEKEKYFPNKDYVGKDASHILQAIGIQTDDSTKLIIAETPENHPLVNTEMLMPVLPIVRVPNVDMAIQYAVKAEKGNRHTAIMHSQNITQLSKMEKALQATIFVKNGPSYSGLGFGGEGFTTLTIAGPTGEGLTSARTFTRKRRSVLVTKET